MNAEERKDLLSNLRGWIDTPATQVILRQAADAIEAAEAEAERLRALLVTRNTEMEIARSAILDGQAERDALRGRLESAVRGWLYAERQADALREAREALRAAHGMHAGDVTAYCAVCALLARADAALSGAELEPGYTAAQMREAYLQGVEDCSDDYGLNLSAETISRFRAEALRRYPAAEEGKP